LLVRHHRLPVTFTGIQNAVLLFLRVLGVMCIVFQMLFATMRSRVALVHMYFVVLEPFIISSVFLLLLCFTFQEIRCTWVMLPFPGRLLVLPRYWPYSWFIPLLQEIPSVQKRVEECFRVGYILFTTVWYVLRVGM
jgi:hypothetical protein